MAENLPIAARCFLLVRKKPPFFMPLHVEVVAHFMYPPNGRNIWSAHNSVCVITSRSASGNKGREGWCWRSEDPRGTDTHQKRAARHQRTYALTRTYNSGGGGGGRTWEHKKATRTHQYANQQTELCAWMWYVAGVPPLSIWPWKLGQMKFSSSLLPAAAVKRTFYLLMK